MGVLDKYKKPGPAGKAAAQRVLWLIEAIAHFFRKVSGACVSLPAARWQSSFVHTVGRRQDFGVIYFPTLEGAGHELHPLDRSVIIGAIAYCRRSNTITALILPACAA
jgi:hypothetical protein